MSKPIKLPMLLKLIRHAEFPRKLGILEKMYGNRLKRNGVCWVECSNGVLWKLNLSDPCHRWIVYGKYEGGSFIDLARSKLESGGVYVDSGANIGQWLLYLSDINALHTLAFEPVRSEREWLEECLETQSQWNVTVIPSGLGENNSKAEIKIDGSRSTLQMDWYKDKNLPIETISICRLDDILSKLEIVNVAFWKLDVEGAEYSALQGSETYLKGKKIGCICFECHPRNYKNICVLLNSFDYTVFDLINGSLVRKLDASIAGTENLVAVPN